MAKKVILDIDPGIDGVLSLCLALFDPKLEVLGVTASSGHLAASTALRILQAIIEYLDPPRLPRIGMGHEPHDAIASNHRCFWNANQLKDIGLHSADLFSPHPAEKIIADLIRAHPNEVTILACGPMTTLARTFARENDLAALTHRLIIVGGALAEPGNATPMAEFNFFRDPIAARQVFRCPAAKTLLPLDVTNKVILSYDVLDHLPPASTRLGEFLRKVVAQSLYSYRQHFGQEGMCVRDALGVLVLTHPHVFRCRMMAGDVECTGELTRGMTVFDRRNVTSWNPNMDVVVSVDVDLARELIIEGLNRDGTLP